MPRVRYTADGGRYRTGGITFEPGDVGDVAPGLAEHLVEDVGEFEYADAEDLPEPADLAVDDADESADGDVHEEDGPPDEDADAKKTITVDLDLVEELQELTISEFEEELETGRFDDRLEAVADAEREGKDRAGIHDAIGVRRAEIEE